MNTRPVLRKILADWLSEALRLDLFGYQTLEFLDIVLFLLLELVPQGLNAWFTFGILDVLIKSPNRVEALAQFLNQVMVVISATHGFAVMLKLPFRRERHVRLSF
jgi:hypothetical protein